LKAVFGLALLACLFWLVIFSPWTSQWGNFWLKMVAATGILALSGLFSNRAILKQVFSFKVSHLATGITSAAILYALFWVGHAVSNQLFGFSESQIPAIYSSKFGHSSILIGLLLFFWIGPAEEIFWRGFLQQRLAQQFGVPKGLIMASLCYGLVHIWALNSMLILAAILCGFFWGAMFAHYKSVWPGIISHAVWDLTIFIIFPLV
jgi:membrane protease YdiL (CAAX protease family)